MPVNAPVRTMITSELKPMKWMRDSNWRPLNGGVSMNTTA